MPLVLEWNETKFSFGFTATNMKNSFEVKISPVRNMCMIGYINKEACEIVFLSDNFFSNQFIRSAQPTLFYL